MRKAVVIAMLIVAATGGSALLLALQGKPDDSPEYFFTRLAYTQNGTRGYGHRVGPGFVCPEFGGGIFSTSKQRWGMDYPGADCKFLGGIHRLTNLRVTANPT